MERALVLQILDEAWKKDLRFLTNQDLGPHPRVDQWSNGTDAAAELTRLMDIRRMALKNFGENNIRMGQPMALMEEVLLPLYLHHRYQVEATAHTLGGQHYIYAMRGDGREPFHWASATEQRAALKALLATIKPSELVLPESVVKRLPPRPSGYEAHRELFPRYTGGVFDVISPAAVAAYHTVSNIFDEQRSARIVEQHAVDPTLPGLDEVINEVLTAAFGVTTASPYEAEIARTVQRVVIDELMGLAASADMPQVRAMATLKLSRKFNELAKLTPSDDSEAAHVALLGRDIKRFLDNPETYKRSTPPVVPPGAPIGDEPLPWIRR